jgi:hypothetical protein
VTKKTKSKKKTQKKPTVIVDLCQTCAYTPGECDAEMKAYGKQGPDFGKVVECNTYLNVGAEKTAPPEPPKEEQAGILVTGSTDIEIKDNVLIEEKPEVFGICQVCEHPLYRTAYNRAQDAVRCLNKSCKLYRMVIQRIPFKSKLPEKGVIEDDGKETVPEAEASDNQDIR